MPGSLPITRRYTEYPHELHKFTGLNIREDGNVILDTQLEDCQNYDLGRAGELRKRTGFVIKHAGATLGVGSAVKVLGFFLTDTIAQLIAIAGTSLYTSTDSVNWTIMPGGPHGAVEYGVQYNNKFYMVRNNSTILKWDGTTCSAIAGSPSGTYCIAFKTRLFVVNTLAAGSLSSRLTFSELFATSADFATWPALNFIDVQPGDGDFLVSINTLHDVLVVFKATSIWTLHVQGTTSTWVVRNLTSSIGCVSKYTIVLSEGTLIFQAFDGVYITDANTVKQISQDIFPAFAGISVSIANANKSCAFLWQDKYIIMLETYPNAFTWNTLSTNTWASEAAQPWGFNAAVHTYYVYHLRLKGWTRWTPMVLAPQVFVPVYTGATLRGIYCSDRAANGKIYKYGDSVYQDNMISYPCVLETKDQDMSSPLRIKRGKWLALKQRGIGVQNITHVCDGVVRLNDTVTTLDSTKIEYRAKGPGFFRMWRIRIVQTSNGSLTFYGLTMRTNIAFSRTYTETSM